MVASPFLGSTWLLPILISSWVLGLYPQHGSLRLTAALGHRVPIEVGEATMGWHFRVLEALEPWLLVLGAYDLPGSQELFAELGDEVDVEGFDAVWVKAGPGQVALGIGVGRQDEHPAFTEVDIGVVWGNGLAHHNRDAVLLLIGVEARGHHDRVYGEAA